LNHANSQSSQQCRFFGFKTPYANQAKVTRIDACPVGKSDKSSITMTQQDCERHAMNHSARGRSGRMSVQVGVEPDQADRALMGGGLGSPLPGPDGAGMVASEHQRLVAPADAFGDR